MKRYESTEVVKRWDGKRVYRTTQYPEIKPEDTDIYVTSRQGDYLDALAYKYYNDPSCWWIIAKANNIGKGRLSIEPGLQLRIPSNPNQIISKFHALNRS